MSDKKPKNKKGKDKVDPKCFFDIDHATQRRTLNENGLVTVKNLASYGLKPKQIAKILGTTQECLYAPHNNAQFKEAMEQGQVALELKFKTMLIKRAEQGSDKCIIFGCKSICGMSDTIIPSTETSALSGFVEAMQRRRSEYLSENDENTDEEENRQE